MSFGSDDTRLLVLSLLLIGVPLAIWKIPKVGAFVPLVLLQLIVGILIGPSFFGVVIPSFEAWMLTPSIQGALAGLALWGSTLFVFFTGLHMEKETFFNKGVTRPFWILSFTSLAVPFALGCIVGVILLESRFGSELLGTVDNRVSYILSIGVSVGVTALPILSAIMLEIGKGNSDIGRFVLGCATVHDVALWIVITVIFGINGGSDPSVWAGRYQPIASFLLVIVLILVLAYVVNPVLTRMFSTPKWHRLNPAVRLCVTIIIMIIFAIASDAIQVHSLLGVVAFGALLPADEKPFVTDSVDILNRAVLLPFFFGQAGIKVALNTATSATGWIFVGITVAAVIGQLIGTVAISRIWFRFSGQQACIMFACMLSKGGVSIIVSTLFLARGVFKEDTYTALLLMAIACTLITKPLVWFAQKYLGIAGVDGFSLDFLKPKEKDEERGEERGEEKRADDATTADPSTAVLVVSPTLEPLEPAKITLV